ncbi:MAG: ATP-binding protein [Pseudomonadota bacterium]
MADGDIRDVLERIADALDRLSPPDKPDADLAEGNAWYWDGRNIRAIPDFAPLNLDLLTGIDDQKSRLMENSQRLADGFAAHDILLWGSRGMGKSALVKSAVGALRADGTDLALIEASADRLDSLPELFHRLSGIDRSFVLFIDDIGFDGDESAPRLLRSLLEGGASERPANVRLYVTANRRHIVPRHMSEQDDPVHPRDILDDKLALSDRFGIRLGFHAASPDEYLAMVTRYAQVHDLEFDKADAMQWARHRGNQSGRIAWQYIVELAGRAGKSLT